MNNWNYFMGISKKASPKKKRAAKIGDELVNFKVPRHERAELVACAKRFAGGNLSAWLRDAGRHYRPAR